MSSVKNIADAELGFDIEDLVRALLNVTQTTEPPTDPDRIAQYLDLKVVPFDNGEKNLDPLIRAYLWPSKREIGISRSLAPKRRTFSILHEVGHFVIPGHASILTDEARIEDTDRDLGAGSLIQREIEANQFAADCLFQLDRFDRIVHTSELDWLNIRIQAGIFQASIEATARRWVESSLGDCAMVVFNPEPREPGASLRIMYTITSRSFRRNYFVRLKPGHEMGPETLVYRLFHGLEYLDEPEDILHVNMLNSVQPFRMRLFDNSYRVFGLLTPLEADKT